MISFANFIKRKKHQTYIHFIQELKQFLILNSNNVTLDKRLMSLYYFLSCHANFDDLIISLNRFLKAKKSYTFSEIMIIRIFKFKLEYPVFWLNEFIKG